MFTQQILHYRIYFISNPNYILRSTWRMHIRKDAFVTPGQLNWLAQHKCIAQKMFECHPCHGSGSNAAATWFNIAF